MKMTNFIPEYEAMTGVKVSPAVARFVEQMNIVSQRFEVNGCKDAAQGLPVPSDDYFQTWGKKLFEDDPAVAEAMANLARLYYMEGYQKGGADDGA